MCRQATALRDLQRVGAAQAKTVMFIKPPVQQLSAVRRCLLFNNTAVTTTAFTTTAFPTYRMTSASVTRNCHASLRWPPAEAPYTLRAPCFRRSAWW